MLMKPCAFIIHYSSFDIDCCKKVASAAIFIFVSLNFSLLVIFSSQCVLVGCVLVVHTRAEGASIIPSDLPWLFQPPAEARRWGLLQRGVPWWWPGAAASPCQSRTLLILLAPGQVNALNVTIGIV